MALDARAWRSCRLGDVVELKRGYDLPQQQRKPGSVPVISSSGPSGFHSEAMAKAPGVVTGRYGTLGQVFFVTSDFWPLNTTLYVRDFKGNDPKFISYFLKTIDFFSCSDKAAVPGVNRNHLHELPVRVPPLDDQRAIAHILGTLDDKIELNRRMNETLEAMARALFKSWFVDFDPVRAKAEGRTPSGMDAEMAKLFPSEFVDSELGRIPKGWRLSTLGETSKLVMGQSPPGDTYNENGAGIPFFQGSTDFGFRFPSRRVFCTAPTRRADPGDTLVSVRAPVGTLNMAFEACAIGRGVAAVRHRSGSRSFTYYLLQSMQTAFAPYEGEGTVFGSINKAAFAGLRHVEPPPQTIGAFDNQAAPLDERISALTKESTTLACVRDELLPRLLSGELPVDAAERVVEEVA